MATKKKSTGKKASKTTRTKAAPKKKRAATKKKAASKKTRATASPKDEPVTIDRRRGERRDEESCDATPAPGVGERREKVQRRRQIDPTTCERDYSDAEVEFMNAMDEYKRTSGRMFPTCSEVLEVIRDLGYVQLTSAELTALGRAPQQASAELEAAEL